MPRPRPAQAPGAEPPTVSAPEASEAEEPPPPSACRLRLTAELAVAQSAPPVVARGECGVEDGVRLEAVFLGTKRGWR